MDVLYLTKVQVCHLEGNLSLLIFEINVNSAYVHLDNVSVYYDHVLTFQYFGCGITNSAFIYLSIMVTVS